MFLFLHDLIHATRTKASDSESESASAHSSAQRGAQDEQAIQTIQTAANTPAAMSYDDLLPYLVIAMASSY